METQVHGWTLGEIAKTVGGELRGPADQRVLRPVPAGSDDPEGITFAESDKYLKACVQSKVGAVLVKSDQGPLDKPCIAVPSPRAAFGHLLMKFARPLPLDPGVHPTAVVSDQAEVAPDAQIGPYAVVERGARVGARCRVFPFAYIGEDCSLAEDCVVYPHAVLYQMVELGARCIVHAGAVLGADGFGFVWDGERQLKVFQVGAVEVGDDVEIGANSCIDRATCGETAIGKGVKLDNLVQVGHNVSIGPDTVIAAHVGIGGSSQLGSRVVIGGAAALSDHVNLADNVVIGGKSGVFQDIDAPGEYVGLPPLPASSALRVMALQTRLPELFRRIKQLESEVEELRRGE